MTDFEALYQTYFQEVYLYCKGLTKNESVAEDITSETFFKAMYALDSFRGTCDIRVWLCQIAKNCYYSYLRKHSRLTELPDQEMPSGEELEERLLQRETATQIHTLLHQLPEPYKEVFTLRALGQLSFQQIGALFEKTPNWACVTYHRAKQKIWNRLEETP